MFFRLAYKSLLSRKGSALLTILAIAVSVFVLLGIEHIRHQAKESFSNTVSGIDLIVGSRTGDINLLLYSVFRLGNATNNISWDTYQQIATNPKVAWTIPIALGDSHQGYRVMGTSQEYFQHFQYGNKQVLRIAEGKAFDDVFDVVLGAEVATRLQYQLGDQVVLAHGIGSTSFSLHDDKPFTVSGILEPTGTPVDQTLHVSLEGIEAIHIDWQNGVKMPATSLGKPKDIAEHDLIPESITAFMVGLESKIATFKVQRDINTYSKEPLLAILPGVTLSQLWEMMSVMENTLRLVSAFVLIAALLGLSAMLLASIRERQREITVMRTIGASPWFLFFLIQMEALLITLTACMVAVVSLTILLIALQDMLANNFGLFISTNIFSIHALYLIGAVIVSALLVGIIPAASAYISVPERKH